MFRPTAETMFSKLSKAGLLSLASASERKDFYRGLTDPEMLRLQYEWGFWGRPDQQLPPGDWFTWLIMTGRGWGKTRTATENISRLVRGPTPLIAPPGAPLRRRRRVRRAHLDDAPIQAARLASAVAFRSASTR
jgi:hypothetical protein